jgi:hypothetical protein
MGGMKDNIDRVVRDLRHNIVPQLPLPLPFLLMEGDQDPPEDGKMSSKAASAPDPELQPKPPQWWSQDPDTEPTWALPPGKFMGTFFNPLNNAGKVNISLFPSVVLHNPKVTPNKLLCIKYQAMGKCRAGCQQAHVKVGSMKTELRLATGEAFKAYAS